MQLETSKVEKSLAEITAQLRSLEQTRQVQPVPTYTVPGPVVTPTVDISAINTLLKTLMESTREANKDMFEIFAGRVDQTAATTEEQFRQMTALTVEQTKQIAAMTNQAATVSEKTLNALHQDRQSMQEQQKEFIDKVLEIMQRNTEMARDATQTMQTSTAQQIDPNADSLKK